VALTAARLASRAVKTGVTAVRLSAPSVTPVMETTGACLSITNLPVFVAAFPARSRAVTTTTWAPSDDDDGPGRERARVQRPGEVGEVLVGSGEGRDTSAAAVDGVGKSPSEITGGVLSMTNRPTAAPGSPAASVASTVSTLRSFDRHGNPWNERCSVDLDGRGGWMRVVTRTKAAHPRC